MLRAVWRMPDGDVFALPSTGTSGDGGRDGEPARAGRHGDRRRGRLLRPPARRRSPSATARASCGSRAPLGRDGPERAILDALDRASRGAAGRRRARRDLDGRAAPARASSAPALFGYDVAADGRLRDVARRRAARRRRAGASTTPTPARRSAWRRRPAWRPWRSRRAPGERIRARRTPVPFSLDLELLRALLDRAARASTTTRRRSCASTRCTRRSGSCSTRASRRAGRGTRPPPRTSGGAARARARAARRPAPPAGAAHGGARARGRRRQGRAARACSPSTGSRSAAGSARARRRSGGSG